MPEGPPRDDTSPLRRLWVYARGHRRTVVGAIIFTVLNKLCDAEGEAAETQVWIEFAVKCQYMEREPARTLYQDYNRVLRTIVGMTNNADKWLFKHPKM